jgi:hypothetical protein
MILLDIAHSENGNELIELLTKFKVPFQIASQQQIARKKHIFVDGFYTCLYYYGAPKMFPIYSQDDTLVDKENKLKDYLIKAGYDIEEPETMPLEKLTLLDEVKEIIESRIKENKEQDIADVREEIIRCVKVYYISELGEIDLYLESEIYNKPHIVEYLNNNGFKVEEIENDFIVKHLKITW